MSMKLMVRILEEIEVTRPQQAVLLSMAENANDDGSSCRPSVDLIAWKAGYKPRAVVDIIRDLRKMGVLVVVKESTQQRPTEYHIYLDKTPQKQTFEEWQEANGRHIERTKKVASGVQSHVSLARENAPLKNNQGCNLTSPGVQSHVRGVQSHVSLARENAPEPVIEPVKNQSGNHIHNARVEYPADFDAFWAAFPTGKGNKKKSYDQWKRLRPSDALVQEIMDSLEHWKSCGQWQRGFVTHAERCLRDRFWENEPPQDPAPATARASPNGNGKGSGRNGGYTVGELHAMSRKDDR